MSVGLGVDIVEIERMRRILDRTPSFAHKVFTDAEQDYCNRKGNPATHYAARFAAKEAVCKALGTGIISTANKADMVSEETYAKAVAQMAELNRAGSEIAGKYDVHSITDVTGFGLMGHTGEMANGGNVTAVIESANVPLLPEVLSLAEIGILPEGMYRNRNFAEPFSESAPNVTRAMMDVLFDPQTSGGLLLAVAEKDAPALLAELTDKVPHAARIGYVTEKQGCAVRVV